MQSGKTLNLLGLGLALATEKGGAFARVQLQIKD